METIAIMIGGAILSATAFTGSNYLAKYISGDDTDEEEKRPNLTTEKYEKDYDDYQEKKNI